MRGRLILAGLLLAVLLVTAGGGTAAASGSEPLIGAIRWDAWFPGNAADPTHWVSSTAYIDWSYREPIQGWNLYGSGVDTQSIIDQEIGWAADHRLDYWAFDWYPENLGLPEGGIMSAFNAYMSSAQKARMHFAFVVQTYWVAGGAANDPSSPEYYWRSTYVPYFVDKFKDSQYLRVAGNRPVVYWFGTAQLGTQPDGFGSGWSDELQYLRDQTRGQIDNDGNALGDPIFIDVNHDTSAASSYGLDGAASYGPSGAAPSSGTHCWDAQAETDVANLNQSGSLLTVPSPTPVLDPRPRDLDPDYTLVKYGGIWSQEPTYGQWESHLQRLYTWAASNPEQTTDPPLLLIYAWNELDEGGAGIVPTNQEQFKYLDAIQAVKSGNYPATYDDVYNGDNCSIVRAGSGWIRYFPASGAYDNDVEISWTPGDQATLTADGATGFSIRFNNGPDRGKVDIAIDGQPFSTDVDLYSPDYEWWDYDTGPLSAGTHTIQVTIRNDHNPSSGGFQVPIDKIVAHLRRVSSGSGASWEFNADGELEGWSPDYQATASVSGGSLQVTATGTDAQIYNPSYSASTSLGLSSSNRYLHIRMRNTTGSTNATVFFITDGDQTWDGAKSKSLAIAPYSDYTDYVIDMGTVAGWLGTIRKLRIDPGDPSVNGGTYDIDSIRALDSG